MNDEGGTLTFLNFRRKERVTSDESPAPAQFVLGLGCYFSQNISAQNNIYRLV